MADDNLNVMHSKIATWPKPNRYGTPALPGAAIAGTWVEARLHSKHA
jgi:hypothetical protein